MKTITVEHKTVKVSIDTIDDPEDGHTCYALEITARYDKASVYFENAEELIIVANVINDYINEFDLNKEVQND